MTLGLRIPTLFAAVAIGALSAMSYNAVAAAMSLATADFLKQRRYTKHMPARPIDLLAYASAERLL